MIERRGARSALITIEGFRDILELGRRDRRAMYGMTGIQDPLIPRRMRWEVRKRMNHRGEVVMALDEDRLTALAAALAADGVDAVVVSFLHAYANPAHELRAKAILQAARSDWEGITSHDIVREYHEFERTSTAVVQGYLQPLVSRYARNLTDRLAALGFDRQTLLMQPNGGLVPLAQLPGRAAYIVRSGPAAGVMAAAWLAGEAGFGAVITGDMGSTSYDVAVVIDGNPQIAGTTELDFRMPLRLPMIDVHTIGAGGGSIAYLDRGGILQLGPRSAGAVPGPICFGRGGTEPTVTDCDAVMGRINAENPIGPKHLARLKIDAARTALGLLGATLGLGIEQTAEAVLTIVNHIMAHRTRLLTVEQGHNRRSVALVIFGGAGPLHGTTIMREVGIRTMLLPPHPGVLCALGCAVADIRYDQSQTIERPVAALEAGTLHGILAEQRAHGMSRLDGAGVALERIDVSRAANMSYIGQIHSMRVPVGADWSLARMVTAFEEVYRVENGATLGNIPVALVGLTTAVVGVRAKPVSIRAEETSRATPEPRGYRKVWFAGWRDTPIVD
ncbi:MAG: hydantoinase/oxoprolinase family protein [Candidatus Saccharibacteria bacterium]|nr:hydantoinase/oxoprolinase family protein [Pseudorhodobacter sp.]